MSPGLDGIGLEGAIETGRFAGNAEDGEERLSEGGEENEAVAREFEERWRIRVEAWPFEEEGGDEGMRTLWPQREATDGFFVARWRVR